MDGLSCHIGKLCRQRETGLAVHQRQQAFPSSFANDGIRLKVAQLAAAIGPLGALVYPGCFGEILPLPVRFPLFMLFLPFSAKLVREVSFPAPARLLA